MSSIKSNTNLPSANNIVLGEAIEPDNKSIKSNKSDKVSENSSPTVVDTLANEKKPATIPAPVSNGKTPGPTAPNSPAKSPVQTAKVQQAPQLPVSEDKADVSSSKSTPVKSFGSKVSDGFKSGMSAIGAGFSYLYNKSAVAMSFVGAKIAAGYGIVKSFLKNLFTAKPKTEEQKAAIALKKLVKQNLEAMEAELNAKVDAQQEAENAVKKAAKSKKVFVVFGYSISSPF